MVTKGIIKSIDIKGNTCVIRIPSFETAGDNEFIATATVSNTPGSYNGYKVNDVVWVAFEDNQFECPVIIGKLYLGIDAEKADPRGTLNVEDSKVSRSAEIPFDTKLGNDIETNMPKTLAPFTSLSNIAGTLSQAEMNIAQNDRDYGNRFKQTSEVITEQGAKLSSQITQSAADIRLEVSEIKTDLEGQIEDTNSSLEIKASEINAEVSKKLNANSENSKTIGLGWSLTEDSWVINAKDSVNADVDGDGDIDGDDIKTLPIFIINRDGVEVAGGIKLPGYSRETVIKYIQTNSNTETPSREDENWSDTMPAWQDGKYIWQWTVVTKWEYNSDTKEWNDTIAIDKIVCMAGASAASYWLKVSSDFHNGKQQNTDLVITAMMKIGTGAEQEDKSAILSYDWFGTSNEIKTNESTEQHKLIFKAPNTDLEGNITGLFPNTKLLITATRNEVDYATKTIEYRPINTPILTLDKESVVFEYNSYGDIKLSPNQVAVKASASLNNEEISNVNYAWEYDENECTCIISNTKTNEIIITDIAEEIDVTTITCKATYKDNLDTDIVLTKSFTVIKNKQGKSLYKLDIENHFVTFNVGYDVNSIKVPTEESATDIYDIINRTTHKISAFYGDDPISFTLTDINPSTDATIEETNKAFRLFKESTNVTEKIYADSDINNHVYTNYITELSTLNGNIIYKLYRGKTMVAASKFEASLLPKGDPTANYWLRSSASKIETDHYGIISDVYFNNTTDIKTKTITFNVIRKSGLETPEYTIVGENINNLKVIINKDGAEYSYEEYIADMLNIDTTDNTDGSDWSVSPYNPINNQKNYTLPISIEDKEVKNFITIQLFDTDVLIDELFIETIATGMPATSYDLKISQVFHLGTNNEKDIVIIPYKKFGTEAETVDSNAYIRYTWAGEETDITWEKTSELTIEASDIKAKDLIVEAAHKYTQDDEDYYEIYKQEIIVYSPINTPVLNLSPDSANIYYNPEVDSNTNENGKINGQDPVIVTTSVLKGGSQISSGITYKWTLKNCNSNDLKIINSASEYITIDSCTSNEIIISEVFKNEVILTCTATLSEKDESGNYIEISKDFKIYREVNTAEYKLRISTPIHTGTAQMSEISVKAVVKIGSNQESADPNVYLRYKWDGENWTNWSKTSEITFIPNKINASGIEFKDANLIVQASRTGESGSEYETETITYSPQNTPIIDLTNDTASIAYDVEGNKIEEDDFVVSIAKVWLAGKPVSTSDYEYGWTLSKCSAKNETQDHKIEIDTLSAVTATATFHVIFKTGTAYAGLELEKEFTISKQLKGDSTINYWLAPSHNNIVRDNNTASWYPNDIYVDVIKQYGIKPAETLDLSEAGVANNFKLKIEVDNTELNLEAEENKNILTITEDGQYKVSLKSAPISKLSLTLYTIDNNKTEHFAYCVNIGVVKDGSSNYSLDIFNDFVSIPADENGDCYTNYDWSLTEHSIKAYYGDTPLALASISNSDSDTTTDINKYYLIYTANNIVFASGYPKLSDDYKTVEIKLADSIKLEDSEEVKYTTVPNQINYELYKGTSKVASGKFELSKLNDGIKATSYWITTTSPVHKGTNQQSPIELTAWSKHGDEPTQVNNELFIRYAWRSENGTFNESDFKNKDSNNNALKGSITINTFDDADANADLCIQTSYKEDFSIITDTEIITYAPAGTPILDLENDYATLSYYYHVDDKKIKKIDSEEVVSTTAKVYLDGNELTNNITYSWSCSDSDASYDITDNSIVVSEIKKDHADFTCTATLSDKSLFKEVIKLKKVFTVAKQVKGDPSISYWLKTSTPVHTGSKQLEDIVITAMHKIGEGLEGIDENAHLFYSWSDRWTADGAKTWNAAGTIIEDNLTNCYTLTIPTTDCEDLELYIKATHDKELTTDTIHLEKNKDKIFDEETITYSPLNTPVLDLDNDTDTILYPAKVADDINGPLGTPVKSKATLYLNGDPLAADYEWSFINCIGECDEDDSQTVYVSAILGSSEEDYVSNEQPKAICVATVRAAGAFQGKTYEKAFTVAKTRKGDNAIYYAIKPEHSTIVYNTEANTWNPEVLKVNFYIYDGNIASLFDNCKVIYTIDNGEKTETINSCEDGVLELDLSSLNISSQVSISLYDANKETIVDTEVIKVLDAAEAPYTIDIFNERVTAITNTGELDYSEETSDTWWRSMTTHKIKIFRGSTLLNLNDEDSIAISDSLDNNENGKYYQLVRTTNNINEIKEIADNSNNTLKTYYITGLIKDDKENPNDSGTITYDLYANKNLVATAVFEFKKITTGISITGVTNVYYATEESNSVLPEYENITVENTGDWKTSIGDIQYGATIPYLWSVEIISYSNGTYSTTEPALIGHQGRGIEKIEEYYTLSENSSPIPTNVGGDGWHIAPPTLTAEKPYLWNAELVYYTDAPETGIPSTPVIIGTFSRSITGVKNYYFATSAKDDSIPQIGDIWKTGDDEKASKWRESISATDFSATKKYLWNYEEIFYDRALDDNSKSKETAPEIISVWSKEIDHIAEHYLISKSMSTDLLASDESSEYRKYTFESCANTGQENKNENPWDDEAINPTNEYPYLWNKETTYYTDGSKESTAPIIIGTFSRSIVGISNYYYATKHDDIDNINNDEETPIKLPDPTTEDGKATWCTNISETGFGPELKYLWNYEEVTYDVAFDDETTTKITSPEIISIYSKEVKKINEFYLISESNDSSNFEAKAYKEDPNAETPWSTTAISPNSNYPYLWNYEQTLYTDGTSSRTNSVIIGTYGETFGFNIITTASSIIKDENVTPTKFTPNEFTIKFNEVSGSDIISCHKSKRNYKFSIQQIVEGSVKDAFAEDTLRNKSIANGDTADTNYDNGFSFNISDRSAYTDPNDQKIYSVEGFLITLYFQTSSGEYIAAKTENIPIIKEGINAINYWLNIPVEVHKGDLHSDSIVVTAMKQVGGKESTDTDAILFYKYNINDEWRKAGAIYYLTFIPKDEIKDDTDIYILATHKIEYKSKVPASSVNGVNEDFYDYEIIQYSPQNTPILTFNQDGGTLNYDSGGNCTSSALLIQPKLYLNGIAISNDKITSADWTTNKGTLDTAFGSSGYNFAGSNSEISKKLNLNVKALNYDSVSLDCTVVYNGLSYKKSTTLGKIKQGDPGNDGSHIISSEKHYYLFPKKYIAIAEEEDEETGYEFWGTDEFDAHEVITNFIPYEDDLELLFSDYQNLKDSMNIWYRLLQTYQYPDGSFGGKTWSDFTLANIEANIYTIKQGKSTNYYGPDDPAFLDAGKTVPNPDIKKGDCWFAENYYIKIDEENLNAKDDYIGQYEKNGNEYILITEEYYDQVVDGRSFDGYEIYNKSNCLLQWTKLEDDTYAWQDISGEIVQSKVTANYVNALDITAKKIEILDTDNDPEKPLFRADGLNGKHKVEIAGFNVTPNYFYKLGTTSVGTKPNGAKLYSGIGFAPEAAKGSWAIWAGPQSGNGSIESIDGSLTNHPYGQDAPFKVGHDGALYSSRGEIAGFSIDPTTISKGNIGEADSVIVSTGVNSESSIGGSSGPKTWAFTAGKDFGVTTSGEVFATNLTLGRNIIDNINPDEILTEYTTSSEADLAPAENAIWTTNIPTVSEGDKLWKRNIFKYSDGTFKISNPIDDSATTSTVKIVQGKNSTYYGNEDPASIENIYGNNMTHGDCWFNTGYTEKTISSNATIDDYIGTYIKSKVKLVRDYIPVWRSDIMNWRIVSFFDRVNPDTIVQNYQGMGGESFTSDNYGNDIVSTNGGYTWYSCDVVNSDFYRVSNIDTGVDLVGKPFTAWELDVEFPKWWDNYNEDWDYIPTEWEVMGIYDETNNTHFSVSFSELGSTPRLKFSIGATSKIISSDHKRHKILITTRGDCFIDGYLVCSTVDNSAQGELWRGMPQGNLYLFRANYRSTHDNTKITAPLCKIYSCKIYQQVSNSDESYSEQITNQNLYCYNISPGETKAYSTGELLQWVSNKDENDSSRGNWANIGGELIANKVTANFVNSLAISTKKIEVIDPNNINDLSNGILFKADAKDSLVQIAGFNVQNNKIINEWVEDNSHNITEYNRRRLGVSLTNNEFQLYSYLGNSSVYRNDVFEESRLEGVVKLNPQTGITISSSKINVDDENNPYYESVDTFNVSTSGFLTASAGQLGNWSFETNKIELPGSVLITDSGIKIEENKTLNISDNLIIDSFNLSDSDSNSTKSYSYITCLNGELEIRSSGSGAALTFTQEGADEIEIRCSLYLEKRKNTWDQYRVHIKLEEKLSTGLYTSYAAESSKSYTVYISYTEDAVLESNRVPRLEPVTIYISKGSSSGYADLDGANSKWDIRPECATYVAWSRSDISDSSKRSGFSASNQTSTQYTSSASPVYYKYYLSKNATGIVEVYGNFIPSWAPKNQRNSYDTSGYNSLETSTHWGSDLGTKEQPFRNVYATNLWLATGTTFSWENLSALFRSTLANTTSCFDAGTQISLFDGTTKNIEDVIEGDIVSSYNTKTGTVEYNKVLKTMNHQMNNELVKLTFDDNTEIFTTMTHPFYTTGGWVSLKPWTKYTNYEDLKDALFELMHVGQQFYKLNTNNEIELVTLTKIQYRHGVEEDHLVYNLDVDGANTFFVNNMLVHNK